MIIAYSSDTEILVCEAKDEKYLLKNWFAKDTGRDKDQYDRDGCESVLEITTHVRVNT